VSPTTLAMTHESPLSRRELLESLAKAGAAVLLTPMIASAAEPFATGRAASADGTVLEQDLPPISLDGWRMTALEITYAPGQVGKPHMHIGFVFGYVLDGELRFKVDGGEETTYHAGQMFYEKPGSTHRVSANASTTKPARFLAMVFVDKTKPLTVPV
jgi:quercetin dioxygenase-like cupin family protein